MSNNAQRLAALKANKSSGSQNKMLVSEFKDKRQRKVIDCRLHVLARQVKRSKRDLLTPFKYDVPALELVHDTCI